MKLTEKEEKIARLALDKAAQPGERQAAAAKLIESLYVRGVRARHEISVSNISCIWTNCIVPFSVERVGTNIYFFNLFV